MKQVDAVPGAGADSGPGGRPGPSADPGAGAEPGAGMDPAPGAGMDSGTGQDADADADPAHGAPADPGADSGAGARPSARRPTRAGRRRSTPILAGSAAVHLAAAATVVIEPQAWPWALGGVAMNHAVLTAAGLWPRSRLLGPNWTHLPTSSGARGEVAITIDDGPDPEVTPEVLDQLAGSNTRATFFCVGERVLRHTALAQRIIQAGHCIENHSHRHRHTFSLLGPAAMRAEIARAQDSIARVAGSAPRFFRAPAGLRNPFLDPVLRDLDLCLTSWTRRGFDTVNGNPDAVYRRLTAQLKGGDILLLHDGHAARGAGDRPVVLEVLPRLLDAVRAQRLTPVTLRAALK